MKKGQTDSINLILKKYLTIYYALVMNFKNEVVKKRELTMQTMMMLRTLGWLCWRLGDKTKAIFCVEKAITLAEQYEEPTLNASPRLTVTEEA